MVGVCIYTYVGFIIVQFGCKEKQVCSDLVVIIIYSYRTTWKHFNMNVQHHPRIYKGEKKERKRENKRSHHL